MGSPPPLDAPSPTDQAAASLEVSFEPSPSGATLCGFAFPLFAYNLAFRIPALPPFPPNFNYFIALSCDLSNPIDAEFSFGGGRVGTSDPDADPEFSEQQGTL